MRIACAAYPLDWHDDWTSLENKLTAWVKDAALNGADLLVFPEYGSMEMATLEGSAAASDLVGSLYATAKHVPTVDALFARLAQVHDVHIVAPSAPVFDAAIDPARPVNRARLIAPTGRIGIQDKQIMTRFERDPWNMIGAGPLCLFETSIGKIGILTCYDAEFPLLGRALAMAGADVICAPSCTEALAGYWRVRIGAMGRALESQCVTAMASVVGNTSWKNEGIDTAMGMGGIFGPPDRGFPSTGVIAEGTLGQPGWTYADVSLAAIADVRRDGDVLNRLHWSEHGEIAKRDLAVTNVQLS